MKSFSVLTSGIAFAVLTSSIALAILMVPTVGQSASVSGSVFTASPPNDPISGARVTLFSDDLSAFFEVRSDAVGAYEFAGVPDGTYRLGCSPLGFAYSEEPVVVATADIVRNFSLGPESEPGRWDIIGSTAPEFLDATDIGFLLPDGKIFYCHDTTDPITFDPLTGEKTSPTGSVSEQGCMNGTLLASGTVLLAGGQDGSAPGNFRDAIPWVKSWDPVPEEWTLLPDLLAPNGRWYPGLARLADGSLLAMGGGTAPAAERTATCELFDLDTQTWTFTGSMINPCEFPPSALLHNGKVLATWSPPQLYDPASGTWSLTGNFQQPARGFPGHADHSVIVLADGSVVAVGTNTAAGAAGTMTERYDPETESWTLGSSPDLVRFQSEVVQLPNGQILVAGGETEADPIPVDDVLGLVAWTDLYDPVTESWRRVADMNWIREYHGVSLLLPDGRVTVTGGTRIKFQVGPTSADIEAYVPPYLLRGVRPEILDINSVDLERGSQVTLSIFPATEITSVVLMGVESTTHWLNAGIPRRLSLAVEQSGTTVTASLPLDPNVVPLGHYMLFAMVDDIPSVARIVRVVDSVASVEFPLDSVGGPQRVSLHPNPFVDQVTIRYQLPSPGVVDIDILDVSGRSLRRLGRGTSLPAGEHSLTWDGTLADGRDVAPGVYLYRIRAQGRTASGRIHVLR